MEGELVPSDQKAFCTHSFYEIRAYTPRQEGDTIWFYCDLCLFITKRKLVDDSKT